MRESSIGLRVIFSIGVFLVLLVPLMMIQSLISERQQYRESAVNEVNKSWGGAQIVAGPVLTVGTKEWEINTDGKKYTTSNQYHFLPDSLNIEVKLAPEKRYRGIYEVVLYKSEIHISGVFDFSRISDAELEKITSSSVAQYVMFNVSDLKGIQENVIFKIDGKEIEVNPGSRNDETFQNSFYSAFQLEPKARKYHFELSIKLKGSETIQFLPLGKASTIHVASNWNNPSFFGEFLPSDRSVTQNGFEASWQINHFNRPYPQEWKNSRNDLNIGAFGVRLLTPVDEYQKSMRTSKYGSMIILLTFLSFFIIELISKKHIHPIQYLLVGLALVLFYSILLAISEYMLFQYSYLISSVLIIGLISFYVTAIYTSGRLGATICTMLVLFYGFMYVILQLQDFSLLLGNTALLMVLGGIMFLTRKVNWYDILNFQDKTNY